jgi:hypothetical protein
MAKVKRDQVALMRTAANVALLAKLAPLFVYEATPVVKSAKVSDSALYIRVTSGIELLHQLVFLMDSE